MSAVPFPDGPADQDVFFHDDKVCLFHADINTWECRTINADMGLTETFISRLNNTN